MEFFAYQEQDRVIGICLTFNIIEEGKSLDEVMKSVVEAAWLHLRVVVRKNLSDDLLNRYAPKEYWEKYFNLQKQLAKQKTEILPRQETATSNTKYTLKDVLGGQIPKVPQKV